MLLPKNNLVRCFCQHFMQKIALSFVLSEATGLEYMKLFKMDSTDNFFPIKIRNFQEFARKKRNLINEET